MVKGLIQPQMTLFGMAIGSDNHSRLGFLGLYSVMVPGLDHLLMDFSAYDATRGSNTSFTYTKDWGNSDHPSWSTVEFEYSKLFNLGSNRLMKQQVLALNGWVADTPTWNQTEVINGQRVFRRPPSFAGINLRGGVEQTARIQLRSLLWPLSRVVQS